MKNLVSEFMAILLCRVVIVVAIVGLSGILVPGATSIAETESVNGFSLGETEG